MRNVFCKRVVFMCDFMDINLACMHKASPPKLNAFPKIQMVRSGGQNGLKDGGENSHLSEYASPFTTNNPS